MNSKTVPVSIVTPEKVALETDAESLVVPAFGGQLGILPGHAPLLAQLMYGEVKITANGQISYFAISGGFVEAHPKKVAIFAETAEMAEEINVERARLAQERAQAELSRKDGGEADIAKAQAALRRALIRLRIAETRSQKRQRI